jgi:hypothetical protein
MSTEGLREEQTTTPRGEVMAIDRARKLQVAIGIVIALVLAVVLVLLKYVIPLLLTDASAKAMDP